jgi:hypothetical protein
MFCVDTVNEYKNQWRWNIKAPRINKPFEIRQCVRVGLVAPTNVTSVKVDIDVVNKLNSEIPIDVSPLFHCVGPFKLLIGLNVA